MPITLGCDLGSSSIKVSLFDTETGQNLITCQSPSDELPIQAAEAGYAEQDPEMWWQHFKLALSSACVRAKIQASQIKAIGISYQMHGLVMVNDQNDVIFPAIIWCDSRAVETGQELLDAIGKEYCFENLLNSPGNFTASKLLWIKQNAPEIFKQCKHFMLPGDFLALRLSGEVTTTPAGLSEGIFWNFKTNSVDQVLLEKAGISAELIPNIKPIFGTQTTVDANGAKETGLALGTPITYRSGDQPNNAFSLGVLEPREVAATAGTSGVMYAVTEKDYVDPSQRVNTFLHVNNTAELQRRGVLLCVNGTGCAYSWLRRAFGSSLTYEDLNRIAQNSQVGSEGILFYPYGNGAERTLGNISPGSAMIGLDFNRSQLPDMTRAVQEGIAFAMYYAVEAVVQDDRDFSAIHAGKANLFLSPVFRSTLSNLMNAPIELCNTDGSQGAARGAAYGAGFFKTFAETFASLTCLEKIEPEAATVNELRAIYQNWKRLILLHSK